MSRSPEVDRLIRDCSDAYVVGPEGYAWRGCARRLAAEVERLEAEHIEAMAAITAASRAAGQERTRAETAEALLKQTEAIAAQRMQSCATMLARAEAAEARAEQQQEALQAAAQVFEWLDNVEWPQSECDAFHGNAGSCPIDYSQAQQAINAALNHDQERDMHWCAKILEILGAPAEGSDFSDLVDWAREFKKAAEAGPELIEAAKMLGRAHGQLADAEARVRELEQLVALGDKIAIKHTQIIAYLGAQNAMLRAAASQAWIIMPDGPTREALKHVLNGEEAAPTNDQPANT